MKTFYFFCDGATEPTNPGPSAFAYTELPSYHDKREIRSYSQYIGHATNNIAELMAIKSVLDYILEHDDHYLDDVSNTIYIYSDSLYALDCIRKWYPNWISKRKLDGKKNLDVIAPAYKSYVRVRSRCKLILEWVKGHSEHWGNDRADELCSIAIQASNKGQGKKIKRKTKKDTIRDINELTESLNALIIEYEDKLSLLKKLQTTLK